MTRRTRVMTENNQMGKAIHLEVPDLVDIVHRGW
jgi:hypothetical protein